MMWRTSPPAGPVMGSASRPRPNALPSLHHCDWTISNWRAIEACRQTKSSPRASPSSGGALGQGRPVGHAAAQDPVARGEPPLPAQRVARVGAPHVGAARAAQAELVVAVAEVVGAQLVVAELGVGAVGAQDERAAVAPAPDELGRDELLVELQPPGLLGELGAEAARRPGAACATPCSSRCGRRARAARARARDPRPRSPGRTRRA